MRILAWITEGGWEAVADAVARLDSPAEITFVHVAPGEVGDASGGALSGLLGRDHGPEVGEQLDAVAGQAAEALLADAARRAGAPDAATHPRSGRAEDVVMELARDADLLVVARDTRDPGPRSIGHAQRFVVDHAPCAVLLLWTGGGPSGTAPPPPPHPPPHR